MDKVKKTCGIPYVLFQWDNEKWGWCNGYYLVTPEYEQEFIEHIRANSFESPDDFQGSK